MFKRGGQVSLTISKSDILYTAETNHPVPPQAINYYQALIDNSDGAYDIIIYFEEEYDDEEGLNTLPVTVHPGTIIALENLPPEAVKYLQGIAGGSVTAGIYIWETKVAAHDVGGGVVVTETTTSQDQTAVLAVLRAVLAELKAIRQGKWVYHPQ
jgi:hypothetical protein